MNDSKRQAGNGSTIGGLIVLGLGLWFLLSNFGVDLPSIGSLWPLFPMLGGLALVAAYLRGPESDPDTLIPGIGGFLCGIFFFLFTLGPLHWSDMGDLWPVFPFILGVAFLIAWWGGGRRDSSKLVPAGIGLLVGTVGLILEAGLIERRMVARGWPVALIVVGAWMAFRGIAGGRAAGTSEEGGR